MTVHSAWDVDNPSKSSCNTLLKQGHWILIICEDARLDLYLLIYLGRYFFQQGGIYCADEYIPYMTIKGLFEKGIYSVFYFLGSIFSVYIFEHINKIHAVDPQTKSPAFRKIKFTAAFRFALTISHTFHLVYSSAFQQLQELTGTE